MLKKVEPSTFLSHKLTSLDLENHNKLCKAIKHRDIGLVEYFIRRSALLVDDILQKIHGVDVHQTPLQLAVISRCPDIVKILLDSGVYKHCRNLKQETPLIMAALMQNTIVVDLLLSEESSNLKDRFGFSHLHIACMRGNIDVVKKLLSNGDAGDVNKTVSECTFWPHYTPLHFAVRYEQVEMVKFLLKCGADITIENSQKQTPLHLADIQRHETIIDLLLEAHKETLTNPTYSQGISHFHIACTRDNTSNVEHFLRIGANFKVFHFCSAKWEPIHLAMYYRCIEVINLLSKTKVYLKADVMPKLLKHAFTTQDESIYDLFRGREAKLNYIPEGLEKFSKFCIDCMNQKINDVKRFLYIQSKEKPYNLNVSIVDGLTLLHSAVKHKSEELVRILLKYGADFLMQDNEGRTALHLAFELKLTKILDLIFRNVNHETPNLIDNNGLSILHILCTTNRHDVIESFIQRQKNIDIQVKSESLYWAGFTPILFAIKSSQYEIVEILLENNADVSITTESGLSCIDFALESLESEPVHREKIVEIINRILSALNAIGDFDDRGVSPLHLSCMINYDGTQTLQQLLVAYSNYINRPIQCVKAPAFDGKTPLELAVQCGQFQQAKLLLENGADLFRVNSHGIPHLELAFSDGLNNGLSIDEAESLFNVAIESKNEFMPSFFYVACISGLPNVVKNVLNNISDGKLKLKFVNYRNDTGQTPLHSVLQRNIENVPRKQIVELLLESGADADARDYMLETPLHLVKKGIDLDITRILLNHGANVNAQNIFGETPIYKMYADILTARDSDQSSISDIGLFCVQITLLLEDGYDVSIFNEEYQTCLSVCREVKENNDLKFEMARVLLLYVKKLQIMERISTEILKKVEDLLRIKSANQIVFYNETSVVNQCERELALMMSQRIDHRTTLHDILLKSSLQMVSYCEDVVLIEMVESDEFVEKFPMYGLMIKFQIKNGRARRLLLEKSRECFLSVVNKSLPCECLDRILGYLGVTDLNNIISSGQIL